MNSRKKAIRNYCVNFCCTGSYKMVRECEYKVCPLWIWRMGKEVKENVNEEK